MIFEQSGRWNIRVRYWPVRALNSIVSFRPFTMSGSADKLDRMPKEIISMLLVVQVSFKGYCTATRRYWLQSEATSIMGWADREFSTFPLLVQWFNKNVGLVFHHSSETFNSLRIKHLHCQSTMVFPTERKQWNEALVEGGFRNLPHFSVHRCSDRSTTEDNLIFNKIPFAGREHSAIDNQ